jgi:DNA polymerase elongation subunit (family B)
MQDISSHPVSERLDLIWPQGQNVICDEAKANSNQDASTLFASSIFAYSWHLDEKEQTRTIIRIYGLNSQNETVCLNIKNYQPYVYIELPSHLTWTLPRANMVCEKMAEILNDRQPVRKELVWKYRLYYAHLDEDGNRKKFPYIRCYFDTVEDIKTASYRLNRPFVLSGLGTICLKMHEHNANPILQLTAVRKLPMTGWILFQGKRIEYPASRCNYEYDVLWENLSPQVSDLAPGPNRTQQSWADIVGRPLIMSYDIEVYSSVPSSMPNPDKPEDKVFQISAVFKQQGAPITTAQKYLLTLFTPNMEKIPEDVDVLCYKTEADLLVGLVNLMHEKGPHVVIGYNIFGFDIPYLLKRSELLGCDNEFYRQGFDRFPGKERLIQWSSSAFKNQSFSLLEVEGRIFIDVLEVVRREYRLSTYTLKAVSLHFLKDQTKDPLDALGIFRCYELAKNRDPRGPSAIATVGKYCVIDSVLVMRLFETLTTWVAFCEMSKVTGVSIFALHTQGQQLRVFSQVYRKCTHEDIVVEKDGYIPNDDEAYVGATVFDPVPGIYDRVLPFDFSSLYPSCIMAYNLDFSTLVIDPNIPDSLVHTMSWEDHLGCSHDPKEIRKAELVSKIKEIEARLAEKRKLRDKARGKDRELLIQEIEELNKSTKPLREERNHLSTSKSKRIVCGKRTYRWLKGPPGVLPSILRNLLDTRAITKKEMKKVEAQLKDMSKDDSKYFDLATYRDVLDQRQLALKVAANSAYGSMGVKRGYLPFMPGAMCTTYQGRCAIEKAASTIRNKYGGRIIYGDTDSNYVSFPHLKTAQECWDYASKVAKEVSQLFPPPMSLAYEEKIYWRFFLLAKKRYMSRACLRDGRLDDEISKKGVLLTRRDNCDFIRNVYAKVVMSIFCDEPIEDVLYYILTEINKLCCRFYPYKDFAITKSVGDIGETSGHKLIPKLVKDNKTAKNVWKVGNYSIDRYILPSDYNERQEAIRAKTGLTCVCEGHECEACKEYYLRCLPAQVQLAERIRRRGQLFVAGSRLEYVITTNGGHTENLSEKIETLEYFQKHSQSLCLDYLYYLHQLANPLDEVLSVVGGSRYAKFVQDQYKYRYKIRSAVINELNLLFSPKVIYYAEHTEPSTCVDVKNKNKNKKSAL